MFIITTNTIRLAGNGNKHAIKRIAEAYDNNPFSAGASDTFSKLSIICQEVINGEFSAYFTQELLTKYANQTIHNALAYESKPHTIPTF